MSANDDTRARLAAMRKAEKDPAQREAYALAERAGFDWYDTESAARRMAEQAGGEIHVMRTALTEANKLLDELGAHLEYCGWGDKWEREVSEKLRKGLEKRRDRITALVPT